MKSLVSTGLGAAALLLCGAGAPPAPVTATPATAPLAFDRFVLPNGLTVIVHTDRSTPSVFVGLWYRTGSRDEPPGRTGFAHLFEHLMFQSTAHRKEEYLAALNAIGAINANGVTRPDHTAYFETVPGNALDAALWLESDRMGYLDGGITQALLDEQRRVVLNEKRQGELRPEEAASRHFLSAFYPAGHPYAHPTIGSTADIEQATLDDVRQWFVGHYGARNAVLVLSGDIDVATARDKVARYFGAIRAGTPISRPLRWIPSFADTRRDRLYGDFAGTTIARSWPVPADSPRDGTLLLLAARAMAGAPDSPLVRALVEGARVATGVTANVDMNALGGVLTVEMAVRPGVSPDRAGEALDRALRDVAAQGPGPERLRSVVAATDTLILRSLEDKAAVGTWLGEGEVAHGDPAFALHQRDWITATTPAEVRAVAARYLVRPFYELVTEPVPPAIVAPNDVDRSRMPAPGPDRPSVRFPAVTTFALSNGLRVVVAPRPSAAMVDLSLQFAAGTDTAGAAATTAAWALDLLPAGAFTPAGDSIERGLSRLGAQLATGAGDWTSSVAWSAPRDRIDAATALVADMVRRPRYPASAVADAGAAALRAVDAYEHQPGRAGAAILKRAVWGDRDPRGRLPDPGDGRGVTRDALLAWHAQHLTPATATLYVVGAITPDGARVLAERHFGSWTGPRGGATAPADAHAATAATAPRVILIDAPGAGQTGITVGTVIPPFDRDTAAAETLAGAVIGSVDGGRLNALLRGEKGWSYGFGGAIDDAPSGARLFVAGGSVQADRTADSLAALRDAFAAVASARPIGQAELDAQRTALVRATAERSAGNQAVLAALATSGEYRLPFDRAAGAADRLAGVTLDQARAAARTLVAGGGPVWVVIGDLASIEAPVRALGLAPVEVWDLHGRRLR